MQAGRFTLKTYQRFRGLLSLSLTSLRFRSCTKAYHLKKAVCVVFEPHRATRSKCAVGWSEEAPVAQVLDAFFLSIASNMDNLAVGAAFSGTYPPKLY